MPKIVKYQLTYLTRPHVVLATSYGREKQEKSHVLVALTDENGVTGYGEATPLSQFTGETTRVAATVLEELLLPGLTGRDSFDIAAVHDWMDGAIAENHAAKCAIDCAMYDLMAKELGVPLYVLLGGLCRSRVAINRHIGVAGTAEAVQMARDYSAQGYHSLKMKVDGDVAASAERIRAVREAIGPEAALRVDANAGCSYPQAHQLIERTLDCGLAYYEQLLPKWDLEGTADLRRRWGVPLLADEAVNSVRDAMVYALHGAADAFTIKLCKCGGLYPALRLAGAAAAAGLKIVVASTYDTHIGCAACLHLAAALPNLAPACDLTTFATQPEVADTCHRLEGMYLLPGDEPGIGVRSMRDFPMAVK